MMDFVLEIALAATVVVFLPLRGWVRYQRKAASSRALIYLLETMVLTAALVWLLYRHGITLQAIGIRPIFTTSFLVDLIICATVVIGSDVISLQLAARQIEKQQQVLRVATSEMSGVFTDALDGGHRLASFVPVVFVGAIWEELCFRGTLFLLIPRTSVVLLLAGIMAGSLLFGSQHLRNGPQAMMYSTFYGLLFSCLYLATNDLIAVTIAHAAGNLFAATYGARRIAHVRQKAMVKASIFVG